MWVALLLAAASAQGGGAPAVGDIQARPPYPSSHDLKTIARWIRDNTSMSLADVVVLGKPFLFAATVRGRSELNSDILVDLDVHEEVLDPTFAQKMRARSAKLDVTVRCQDQHILTNALTFYSGANLTGSAEQSYPHTGWVAAPAGDFAAELVASACDPGYKRPFATLITAQAAQPSKPTEPPNVRLPAVTAQSREAIIPAGPVKSDHLATKAVSSSASKTPPSKPAIYSVVLGAYSTLQRAENALDVATPVLSKFGASNQGIVVHSTGGKVLFLSHAGDWDDLESANSICSAMKQANIDCQVQSR
jgi:hypothetical protein